MEEVAETVALREGLVGEALEFGAIREAHRASAAVGSQFAGECERESLRVGEQDLLLKLLEVGKGFTVGGHAGGIDRWPDAPLDALEIRRRLELLA